MIRPIRTLLPLLWVSACTMPGGASPSLAPRAAEAIDPRVAVVHPADTRPVDPALAARLSALTAQAKGGDGAFRAAVATAQRLADSAGPAKSENWILAQQALSAAVAARAPTTGALSEIDAIGAQALATHGGMSPADLSAVQAAAAEVGAIDRHQAALIAAIVRRLG